MKPMLAAATDGSDLTYPLLASPKLDGVRALVIDGVVVSRSLKPIPNKFVQRLFGKRKYNGFDGELIVGPQTAKDVFQSTTSGVMSVEGQPNVTFCVFDNYACHGQEFRLRYSSLIKVSGDFPPGVVVVPHVSIGNEKELFSFEEECLARGYEGVMLRKPAGLYKYGRSTLKQGWLLKLKRFADSEAKIIGVKELMHNTNEATFNYLGQQERSHKKAGMVGKAILGSLMVEDLGSGITFDIGTGFTGSQRIALWAKQESVIGKIVKYKHQPTGAKEKPRFPVFLGFRGEIDL